LTLSGPFLTFAGPLSGFTLTLTPSGIIPAPYETPPSHSLILSSLNFAAWSLSLPFFFYFFISSSCSLQNLQSSPFPYHPQIPFACFFSPRFLFFFPFVYLCLNSLILVHLVGLIGGRMWTPLCSLSHNCHEFLHKQPLFDSYLPTSLLAQ
jgi:hypothetical protein